MDVCPTGWQHSQSGRGASDLELKSLRHLSHASRMKGGTQAMGQVMSAERDCEANSRREADFSFPALCLLSRNRQGGVGGGGGRGH